MIFGQIYLRRFIDQELFCTKSSIKWAKLGQFTPKMALMKANHRNVPSGRDNYALQCGQFISDQLTNLKVGISSTTNRMKD